MEEIRHITCRLVKDNSPVKKRITVNVKYTLKSVIDHFDSSKHRERKETGKKI